MSAPDIILKLSNIESYYGPIMAIRGVSLEVPRGKIVTVLGANGAGKTTILKTISGVLDPQKGSVEFEGKPIQRMDADKIVRLGLSHVPEGREVFPFLTVRENLMMGAYLRKDRDGVAEDLERVYGYFPRLQGAPRPAGRPAVRRRAADAGDQPRADEPAEAAAARRAVARPVADPGQGDLRASSSASTRSRACRSCWSSRTPRWRWRPRTTAMCWRSAASSWTTPASG